MAREVTPGSEQEGTPFVPDGGWQEIVALLAAGDYGQVAELLDQKQSALRKEDIVVTRTLAAARQLCLTCRQYRSERKTHRQALDAAAERESALRQQILSLLAVISDEALADVGEDLEAPASIEAADVGPSETRAEEGEGLWRWVRRLLGLEGRPSTSAAEGPPGATPEPIAESEPPPEGEAVSPAATRPAPADEGGERVKGPDGAALTVYCLGPFRVYQHDQPVEEWPSLKGQSIFKYLVAQGGRPVNKEVLMDLFWAGADPDSARNNLNVAIYGLRQAFRQVQPDVSYVLFRDDCYLLNSDLFIWVDVEAFNERFARARKLEQRGELAQATREYHAAEALYQGEFLEEDRYEEWLLPLRRRLRDDYLEVLNYLSQHYFTVGDYGACINLCSKTLAVDRCREEAHRLYMRCCSRQGQRYLALRQYHRCAEALAEDLEAIPSEATVGLYEKIRQGQSV